MLDQLRVWFSKTDHIDLQLHTTDEIRQSPRARGLDDQPRAFEGDIEIPQSIWARCSYLSTKAQEFIHLYLKNQRNTPVHLDGTTGQIRFKEWGWEFRQP